jgi:purine-nucleoside phosphorylase
MSTPAQVDVAYNYLRAKVDAEPRVAVVLGSGIPRPEVYVAAEVPFAEVPFLAAATVEGHAGRFVFGFAPPDRTPVVLVDGRLHFFEGHAAATVLLPVRLCARLGCRAAVVTGTVGAVRPGYDAGDVVLLTDHLNVSGISPLAGPYYADFGARFVSPAGAYDKRWRERALAAADELGINLKGGVYAMVAGPTYETAAEAAMLARLGADVVGMSVVPEVLAARQAGLTVLGLAVVANAAGRQATRHDDVLARAAAAGARAAELITVLLPALARMEGPPL